MKVHETERELKISAVSELDSIYCLGAFLKNLLNWHVFNPKTHKVIKTTFFGLFLRNYNLEQNGS